MAAGGIDRYRSSIPALIAMGVSKLADDGVGVDGWAAPPELEA
jgi:hypothetical protein